VQYYFDPVSSRRFRSKNEVLYFLETGTKRKKGKLMENSDAETMVSQKPKVVSLKVLEIIPFHSSNFPFSLTCTQIFVAIYGGLWGPETKEVCCEGKEFCFEI
jgi:hypothetical protein